MKKKTNVDYYEDNPESREKVEAESLMDIWEHMEELKKNPPKSKIGKKKLEFYSRKLKEYE